MLCLELHSPKGTTMKLGEGVEAAIHCTALLGALPQGAVLPAAALAEKYGLSPSYLLKTLKLLVADGILTSISGPLGGYRLARGAEEITLRDIVLSVSGHAPAFRCQDIRRNGPCAGLDDGAFPRPCGISVAMLKAEAAYRDALAQTSIADLVQEYQETSSAPARAAQGAFLQSAVRGRGE